jgi:hypothetical protein
VLQSKSIEQNETWPPSKIKARGKSQSKEYLEKQIKIFHTLAHLDQVAWLVSSWIQSLAQQHYVAQVSLILILPKAPHTNHRVRSWGCLKSLWWGNKLYLSDRGNHPRNFVSLCENFKTPRQDSGKEKIEWCKVKTILLFNLRRRGGKSQAPQVKHG